MRRLAILIRPAPETSLAGSQEAGPRGVLAFADLAGKELLFLAARWEGLDQGISGGFYFSLRDRGGEEEGRKEAW